MSPFMVIVLIWTCSFPIEFTVALYPYNGTNTSDQEESDQLEAEQDDEKY